jgi:hypothetical protein
MQGGYEISLGEGWGQATTVVVRAGNCETPCRNSDGACAAAELSSSVNKTKLAD